MFLTKNDLLIRLRYALDIKDSDMVEIFQLGGADLSLDEVRSVLRKPQYNEEEEVINGAIALTNETFEQFLNGFITYKRGKQEPKPGQPERPMMSIKRDDSVNNVLLKKVKIALALKNEDMIDILEKAGVRISKGELSALLRKEGHINYQVCGNKFARNFLKGLALTYRD